MPTIATTDLITHLNWRYAVKQFDRSKIIPSATWDALAEALVLSPSSYGLQPWKFIVVTSAELKKRLRPASWNQSQVEDCSHFVVLAGKKTISEADVDRFVAKISAVRGAPVESLAGYRGFMVGDLVKGPRSAVIKEWAVRQVYIALGNLMTCAAVLGVDACPMEGIEPPKFDEILGLTGGDYATAVACALGYRHADDKYAKAAKVRYAKADVIDQR